MFVLSIYLALTFYFARSETVYFSTLYIIAFKFRRWYYLQLDYGRRMSTSV